MRLLRAEAWTQPAEYDDPNRARRAGRRRARRLAICRDRHPRVECVDARERAVEPAWCHADDRHRPAVENDRSAQHAAVATQLALPKVIADDDNWLGAASAILRAGVEPPQCRSDAEHLEVVTRGYETANSPDVRSRPQ